MTIQPSVDDDQACESRLRSLARRQGYRVVKSRCREPRASVFGTYGIVDPYNNTWVAYGGGDGYGMTLGEIEAALNDPA